MASKISTLFVDAINEGLKAAKLISDPAQKANAYASIASAIAHTGLVSGGDSSEAAQEAPVEKAAAPEKTTAPAEKAGKNSLKPTVKPKVADKPAPTPEPAKEPEAQVESEGNPADEWNDETLAAKADELALMQQCREYYGDEAILTSLSEFSDGVLTTFDDITPLNIDGFLEYLKGLAAQE